MARDPVPDERMLQIKHTPGPEATTTKIIQPPPTIYHPDDNWGFDGVGDDDESDSGNTDFPF